VNDIEARVDLYRTLYGAKLAALRGDNDGVDALLDDLGCADAKTLLRVAIHDGVRDLVIFLDDRAKVADYLRSDRARAPIARRRAVILRRVVVAARMIASALRNCPRDVRHLVWKTRQAASFVLRGECRAFDPAHIERASGRTIEMWPPSADRAAGQNVARNVVVAAGRGVVAG
jgi:hypothetical protein